jgi:hypothetical protein
MDTGELIFISSRLVLGAAAAFFAIMLWSRTRDAAWMLMIIGTLIAYIETVYSILDLFDIVDVPFLSAGSIPLASILLAVLRIGFIIAAFLIMIVRRCRYR